MTEKTLPLRATLKAGTDYSAPWLTVDGADALDLAAKLADVTNSGLLEVLVTAADALKSTNGGGAPAPAAPQAPAQPVATVQQPQTWGASPAKTQPSWSQPQQAAGGPVNGSPHPEGIVCPVDGKAVVFKQTQPRRSDGKTFKLWVCPDQKSQGDGHHSAFAD